MREEMSFVLSGFDGETDEDGSTAVVIFANKSNSTIHYFRHFFM
jgi:hypothetical protein